MASWEEVQVAKKEERHEIVLSGSEISKRIEDNGLDECLFGLQHLNFLEISQTCMVVLPEELGNLSGMTNLVLRGNKLETVPVSIGKLTSLKMLDLSRNEIDFIPQEMGSLAKLESLNLSGNKLCTFPDMAGMTGLHIFDISHNLFEVLPDGICTLPLLAQILVSGNSLICLPSELSKLPSLKTLDVSENKLETIPSELSLCSKLKELKGTDNKLKDKRLGKMLQQCTTKAVLDYLRNNYDKENSKGKGKKSKKKRKGRTVSDEEEDLTQNVINVAHFNEEKGVTVLVKAEAIKVRPYFVGCVLKNIDLKKSNNLFKRFIALQTKLHDTICNKRQAATIATHDLDCVKGPLVYTAMRPDEMKITPLHKLKETSAKRLVGKLKQEAEEHRKEKKRSTFSGIHKYLNLLDGHPLYPCVVDNDGMVVSFPPITNCDSTKVSKSTSNIFVEVTSSSSLDLCKKVMDQLLRHLLEMGIGGRVHQSEVQDVGADGAAAGDGDEDDDDTEGFAPLTQEQVLDVEQVKIADAEGGLRVIYPSRTDLLETSYRVNRQM